MLSDPILNTLVKLISLYDGIAEPADDRLLNVLLSDNIAKQLNLSEEVTLTTRADVTDGVFVTYHSELLQKFSELLSKRGVLAALGVQYNGYLKMSGFEKQILAKLRPQNGLIRFLEAKSAITRYLWCHVSYTAEADEKRVGMVSFMANELTGVAPVSIGDALLWEADRLSLDTSEPISEQSLKKIASLIEKTAAKLTESDLKQWQAKLSRAKIRDEDRLKAYYGTMIQEIENKIHSRHLEGEDKDRELARIEATRKELKRKLADLQERYELKVNAALYSMLLIHLPTVHLSCELVRKKVKRLITVVWNPFTKMVEPLACEQSGEPVEDFYLDDEAKILSSDCWNPHSAG